MNRIILAMLSTAIVLPVMAGEQVSKEVDADPNGVVSIDVVRGKVTVVGWDKNLVSVNGTRDDKSREFTVERSGKVVAIEDDVQHSTGFGGSEEHGTKITVQVPRGSDVKIDGVSLSMEVSDVGGTVNLETVSGDIKADKLAGEVNMETVSGDVNARVDSARIHAETVSGDLSVVNAGILSRGKFSSVSGSATVDTVLAGDGDLHLEAISGDLTLVLRGEINARIKAETGPGGSIENKLTEDVPDRERYTHAESVKFRIGNGGADVDASVVTGEIVLKKNE